MYARLTHPRLWLLAFIGVGALLYLAGPSRTQQKGTPKPEVGKSSYDQIAPVLIGKETFAEMMAKDKAKKADVMARQQALLEERYDLSKKVDAKVTMFRGKPIPVGPTAKLPEGTDLGQAGQACRRRRSGTRGCFPRATCRCRTRITPVGGMVFPQHQIKQFPRLERFDLDFDLPEHFLPEFPPAMFLTTRPDLGDVSQGKVVTLENFQEIFQGILNAKDLEGMRLLVTQFPQQQFNATPDRKAATPDGMKGRGLFRLPRQRPHRRPPRIWSATSGRSRTAAASTRSACAASTCSASSARSGP